MLGTTNESADGLPNLHGVEMYSASGAKVIVRLGTTPMHNEEDISYAFDPIILAADNPHALRRLALLALHAADHIEGVRKVQQSIRRK